MLLNNEMLQLQIDGSSKKEVIEKLDFADKQIVANKMNMKIAIIVSGAALLKICKTKEV